ncbi:MAG: kinase-like domain-containing protein [Monoraphidium minutum]|nr:MAG: kinase-like domain-containing protein [Monoraphidium minutum]
MELQAEEEHLSHKSHGSLYDAETLLARFKELLGDLYIESSRLEFISELGVGELAIVERGQYHPPSGGRAMNVVVKGYSPHVIATPEDMHALLSESRNIQRLHHRHLVKLLGLGCFHHTTPEDLRGSLFMVEEFVGTMSLKALLRLQRRTRWRWLYTMTTALRWATSLASALAALHAAEPPYVHGDVKAINVFLTDTMSVDSATVKLGDLKPHSSSMASSDFRRASMDSGLSASGPSGVGTPRASAAAAAAAAAALILPVPEDGAASAPLPAGPLYEEQSVRRVSNPSASGGPSYGIVPGSSRQYLATAGSAGGGPKAASAGGGEPRGEAAAAGGGEGGEGEGGRTKSILRPSSSIQPDGSRTLSGGKAVHFEVARAAGITPNRDWGLLYASPELLRKRELSPAADTFAFGVLLYELLARRLVAWSDDSEQAAFYERSVRGGKINVKKHGDESLQLLAYAERVADGYRPPLPEHWPAEVVSLVDRCWAADPAERPPITEVHQVLAALMKDRKLVRQLDSQLPPNMPQASSCACAIS